MGFASTPWTSAPGKDTLNAIRDQKQGNTNELPLLRSISQLMRLQPWLWYQSCNFSCSRLRYVAKKRCALSETHPWQILLGPSPDFSPAGNLNSYRASDVAPTTDNDRSTSAISHFVLASLFLFLVRHKAQPRSTADQPIPVREVKRLSSTLVPGTK